MNYENYILNLLLDKYESSKSFYEGHSRRRILYKPEKDRTLNKKLIKPSEKEKFIKALKKLKDEKLIDFNWEKFEENNLVKEIWLVVGEETLVRSYSICDRESKSSLSSQIIEIVEMQRMTVETEWIKTIYQNILDEAKQKGKHWKFPLQIDQTIEVSKVLSMLDNNTHVNINKRLLSVRLFADSKYFEKNVQKKLLHILNRYLFDWDENELTDKEKLQQIGIGYSPEILYFAGPVNLVLNDGQTIDCSSFNSGYYLGADMLPSIKKVECPALKKIITIENLTNYYWYLQREHDEKCLVVYTGGFITKNQSQFLKKLILKENVEIYHWGDIDLGGFRILLQMKTVLPKVKPLKMDLDTFEKYSESRKKVSSEYVQRVQAAMELEEFRPFYDILNRIVETKQILEQEAELYLD